MQKLLEKTLTSRKFWAAVAGSAPLALAQDWHAFAMVWVAYIGAQAGVDAMETRANAGQDQGS
jgi:hypothetical protein